MILDSSALEARIAHYPNEIAIFLLLVTLRLYIFIFPTLLYMYLLHYRSITDKLFIYVQ